MKFKLLGRQRTVLLLLSAFAIANADAKKAGGKPQVHLEIPDETLLSQESSSGSGPKPDDRQKEDQNRYAAFLEEEERSRKVLSKNDALQGKQTDIAAGKVALNSSNSLENLVEGASMIALALIILIPTAFCVLYLLKKFPE
jgi:hypothetical protein